MKNELQKVKVKERIFVNLNEVEIQARAELLVDVTENLKDVDIEFKGIKKEWSEKIKNEKSLQSDLSRSASTGKELQTVVAIQVFDPKNKRTWIEYQNEKYNDRPLTMAELESIGNSLFKEAVAENKADEDAEEGPTEEDNNILKVVNSERKVRTKKDHTV